MRAGSHTVSFIETVALFLFDRSLIGEVQRFRNRHPRSSTCSIRRLSESKLVRNPAFILDSFHEIGRFDETPLSCHVFGATAPKLHGCS